MSPDGTLITDIEQTRASSDNGSRDQKSRDGAQLAALPEAAQPLVIARPAPGERIEVDLDATPLIRLAVNLTGAQVDVSGGKIVVTLPDGGVIVLQGGIVQQFLAGGDAGIEDFLATAAGDAGMTEIGSPAAADDQGSGFRPSGVVADSLLALNAAGALGATELGYGTPQRGETLHSPVTVGASSPPGGNTPPEADDDRALDVLEDSANTALGINAPTDVDGDTLTITVTSIPDAAIGTVYLADGSTPVSNGMSLTAAELTG
ncbi:MAG: hypothetical protein ACREEV_10560, partial [Dongiaceae bacterium]